MKIYNANLKVLRFDFNIEILKTKPLLNIKHEITFELYPPSDGIKNACRYGIRIANHIMDEKSNKEAIGYLSEWFSDFVIGNIITDMIDIRRYVENGFLNHEVYFQENKPKEVILDNLILNPNIDKITEGIFAHLKESGYYN